jgi:AraC-like DNA-binding protein
MEDLSGLRAVVFFPGENSERNAFLLRRMGHKNPFCDAIKRRQFSTCIRCCNVRRHAMAQRREEPFVDECDFGVTELVVPLITEDTVMATISLGQLRHIEDESVFTNYLSRRTRASGVHLDSATLRRVSRHFRFIPAEAVTRHGQLFAFALSHATAILGNTATETAVRIRNNRIVAQVAKRLHQASPLRMSQKEMAGQLGITPEYLSRLFRKTVGKRYIEYVNEVRISRAQSLLKTTDLSIGDIACEVGNTRHSYFSRLFKNMVGMTPQEYRASHRAR